MVSGEPYAGFPTLVAMSNYSVVRHGMSMTRDVKANGVLITPRLCLRPIQSHYRNALHEIIMQSDVRRYLFDDRILDEREVDRILAANTKRFVETGTGLWGIHRHDDTQLIGFANLRSFQIHRDCEPQDELGIALDSDYQNQGYAFEACNGLIDYAREALGWSSVHASIDPRNTAASRTMWRLGFVGSEVVRGKRGPLHIVKLRL